MRTIRYIVFWFFVLCLPLLIISSNIAWGVTSIWVYDYSINKYPISQTTGIDNNELHEVYQHLIDFYNLKVLNPSYHVI